MSTKHTPGPWNVNTHPDYESGLPAIVWGPDGPGFGAICDMAPFYSPRRPRDFNEADARLIAAAPELLAVLEEALRQSGCDGDLCAYAWHEKARAAIAKATGAK